MRFIEIFLIYEIYRDLYEIYMIFIEIFLIYPESCPSTSPAQIQRDYYETGPAAFTPMSSFGNAVFPDLVVSLQQFNSTPSVHSSVDNTEQLSSEIESLFMPLPPLHSRDICELDTAFAMTTILNTPRVNVATDSYPMYEPTICESTNSK